MRPHVKVRIFNPMAKEKTRMKSKTILNRITEIIESTSDIADISRKMEVLIKDIHGQHPPHIAAQGEVAVRNFLKEYARISAYGDA